MSTLFNDHAGAEIFFAQQTDKRLSELQERYQSIVDGCNPNAPPKYYPTWHKKAGQKMPNNHLQMPELWKQNMKKGLELVQAEIQKRLKPTT